MTTNVWKFLWNYLSKLKILFFSVLSAVVLGEFFTRLAMFYGAEIVNVLSGSGDRGNLLSNAAALAAWAILCLFAKGLLLNIMIFVEARYMPVYFSRVSKDLFQYAHQHSTAFFAEEMAGNISGKIKTIIDNSYNIYFLLLWGVITPTIALIISFVFIWKISFSLAMLMLALNFLLIYILYRLSVRISPYSETRAKLASEANGILVDSITNASLVKNFSNYFHEKKIYFQGVKKAALADRRETKQFGILFIVQGLVRSLLQAVFYALPLWYWYKGLINVGDYVLIQSLILLLANMYNQLSMTFLQFFKLYGGIKDGLKLLAKPCDVVDKPGAKDLKTVKGAVSFCDVTYHYKNSKPLFKDFNLEINAGEKVGLVGRSGSGKSTLIKLLSRYYDIQKGAVCIDGQNIAEVTQDSLRRQIALIPQDPSLFNRTIIENIRYGNLRATDEEVFAAARQAYCDNFIRELPNGYDSKVGERGVMLSGGERQRIAIARAILKNAPILILDEATSALDSESEKYIQESLKKLMRGKTVIAIAHRLSTLKEMDKLVIMDKGKIIEEGSHGELIGQNGVYAEFYNMQTSGFLKLPEEKK